MLTTIKQRAGRVPEQAPARGEFNSARILPILLEGENKSVFTRHQVGKCGLPLRR